MGCKTCNELLAAYKRAAKQYTEAMQAMSGLVGDDFRLALKELERWREASRGANDALTEHWRQEHGNPTRQLAASS